MVGVRGPGLVVDRRAEGHGAPAEEEDDNDVVESGTADPPAVGGGGAVQRHGFDDPKGSMASESEGDIF